MQSISNILKQVSLVAAAAVASPAFAESPASGFPAIADAFSESSFVFPVDVEPRQTMFSAETLRVQPLKPNTFRIEGDSASSPLPAVDLGVDTARFTAMYGAEKGAVTPMGPFFLHSNGNNKAARMDFGVIAGGLTASVGFAAKITDGQPLNVRYGETSYSLPTSDLTTARALSISKVWSVGDNWSILGKDVDQGLFAIGVSTEHNAKRARVSSIDGVNYLVESPGSVRGNNTFNVGLYLKF